MSRKIKNLVLLLCMALLTCSLGLTAHAEEVEESKVEQLWVYGNGLTDSIIRLSDEEIASFEDSEDSFTVAAMDAWKNSKDELGELLADQVGEVTVTEKAGKYTVTVPRTFEKANVNFVYMFNRSLKPTTITIDVKLPMGVTLVRALLNTLIGICTVFLVLLFLSFVISLLGKVPALVEGKKKGAELSSPAARAMQAPAPAAAPVPVAAASEDVSDDLALVAVITAAIEAYTGMTSGDDFVVRSIRKAVRRKR